MRETGERAKAGDNAGAHRGKGRSSSSTTTLADLGITRDQSSKWQKLADLPEPQFEEALTEIESPTTDGLLGKHVRGTFGTGENALGDRPNVARGRPMAAAQTGLPAVSSVGDFVG